MTLRALRPALLLCLALLTACGGGGGDSAPPATPATPPVLMGVVSMGAPMGGASLRVIDASGKAVASGSSHPVDGSYRLTLSESSPALPLLLQARGLDATGRWQVLHALLPALPTAEVRQHLTPLTQAIAALALGGDPAPVFATPAGSVLPSTSPATVAAAIEFLRTLVKTGVGDLKLSSTLDLQGDAGFATAKSGPDLLLEALRIEVAPDAAGAAHLLLSNKFALSLAPEVDVLLSAARTELLKTSDAAPANAITTAAKATSSASTVLTNLGSLDGITTSLNPLLARAADPLTLQTSDPLLGYTQHDGADSAALALQLAAWGAAGLQLGPLQVSGCADDVAKTGDCLRVLVASTLTDRNGKPQARLQDAASYNSTSKRWTLIGNGKILSFQLRAASLLKLDASGSAGSAAPTRGIEVLLQGRSGTSTLISSATVQTPLGYALPLADCGLVRLCLATPGATFVLPGGGLEDHLLQPGMLGWLGEADAVRGARYQAAYARNGGTETRRAWLPTAVLAQPAARHPVFKGVSSSAPLSVAALNAGLALDWSDWAAAHPDLHLLGLRVTLRYASRADVFDFDISGLTSGRLPAIITTETALGHEIWLTAVNPQGQRLVTRYALGV